MDGVCPLCKREDQVLSLAGYWGGLPPSSENYPKLRQPDGATINYLYAVGVAIVGVLLMVAGGWVLGLLVILAGAGWGFVMNRQVTAAEHKRTIWQRSKWCGRCAHVFDPKAF
ncbi:hypothetical protein [Streptomyces sp. NPDC020983]|uniref:hypothetical protein n=1 Tax=Streptomyces sp. NPDC020983 TaxID=3365106 RepID=UPI0037919A92